MFVFRRRNSVDYRMEAIIYLLVNLFFNWIKVIDEWLLFKILFLDTRFWLVKNSENE